jgi:hypothetical protein
MSAPLIALVTLIYLGVAWGYYAEGRPGMAFTFIGYSVANIGLIWDSLSR